MHNPGCTGKRRYSSGERAMRVANLMFAEHGVIRPYLCSYCAGWHLSSEPRSVPETAIVAAIQPLMDPAFASSRNERVRRKAERAVQKRQERAIRVFDDDASDA